MIKKPVLTEEELLNYFTSINLKIGDMSHSYAFEIKEEILNIAENHCNNIDDETLKFVSMSVTNAYFVTLKSYEETLTFAIRELLKRLNL